MRLPSTSHLWGKLKAARSSQILALVWLSATALVEAVPTDVKWEIYRVLGLSRDGLFGGGVWRPVTHALLHGGWIHTALNGIAMLLVGMRLERIGGAGLFWRVMAAGVLAGGVVHVLLDPGRTLVGGSGGVLAGLLYLTAISPDSRMWPLPVSGKNLGRGFLLASVLLAIADPRFGWSPLAAFGTTLESWIPGIFDVSHACHAGGAIAGLLLASWALRPRVTLKQLRRAREKRERRQGSGE